MFCASGPCLPSQQSWRGDWKVRIPKETGFPSGLPDRTLVSLTSAAPSKQHIVCTRHLCHWAGGGDLSVVRNRDKDKLLRVRQCQTLSCGLCVYGISCLPSNNLTNYKGLFLTYKYIRSQRGEHNLPGHWFRSSWSQSGAPVFIPRKTCFWVSGPSRRVPQIQAIIRVCTLTLLCPHNIYRTYTMLSTTLCLKKTLTKAEPLGSAHPAYLSSPCEIRFFP